MDENKMKPVYKMSYAMKLIQLGHTVAMTSPNPRNQKLVMWFFIDDDTFDEDFRQIRHIGKMECWCE